LRKEKQMDDSTIKIVLSFGGVVLGFALSQMVLISKINGAAFSV